jgi:2'-hydroxyisoflavone reductase
MAEKRQTGVYNADGPDQPYPLGRLLEDCREASGSDARFTWVSQEFLLEHGVGPWVELPLWVPESEEYAGFFSFSSARAVADGLTYRPVPDTVRDTLAWDLTRPADVEWRAGLKPEREQELLRAWHRIPVG